VSLDGGTTLTIATLRQARVEQERVVRWVRLLAPPLLVLLFVLTAFQGHPHPGLSGRGLVVSIALLVLVLNALGLSRTLPRPLGLNLVFVVVLFACSVALMWAQPSGPGSVGVFLAVLIFARRLPGRGWLSLALLAFVVLVAVDGFTSKGASPVLLAFIGGFIGMAFLVNRLGEANEQAEQLVVQLEESRAREARAAGLAERQRLAREMHDVLAHSLSGLMLQLEVARMLAAKDPQDPRLPDAIDRAHDFGRTGLEEARRAIGTLRDAELPGPERLPGLAAQFQKDRGIPCRFTVSGEDRVLNPEARLAVYRVAQEALTNITKHAHPELVELHLAYEPGATRLTIEDFSATASGPSTAAVPSCGGGYGLTGMRERAELLGGTLLSEATGCGFRVELDVPA
jgi:signal transduction histidine kinase